MYRMIVLWMAAALMLASCGNNNVTKEDNPKDKDTLQLKGEMKIIGSQTLYPMMVRWASNFIEDNKQVRIVVRGTESEKAMQILKRGQSDIAMISRKLTEQEIAEGYWAAPVALDAVVAVFSFDNHHIQPLVMKGASPAKLAGVFTGKVKQWGELADRPGKEEISVYCLDDSSGTAATWYDFLDIKTADVKGQRVISEMELIRRVKGDANAIGFCSLLGAYNTATDLRKDGIYILPIDYNNNRVIEDNEQYYDKLSLISSALTNGKMPKPPARELYIVTKGKPSGPLMTTFIEWLLGIGQNYMPELGFIHLSPEQAKAAKATMK